MEHFALSPEANLKNIQWPPRWFYFNPAIFEPVQEILPGISWLRTTNPELRRWTDLELSAAWKQYTEDMGAEDQTLPEYQDMFFSAYLFARQELGVFEGKLDELSQLWKGLVQSRL